MRHAEDSWAEVELFRWQHGELPTQSDERKLDVSKGLLAMAKSLGTKSLSEMPGPSVVATILEFCARKLKAPDVQVAPVTHKSNQQIENERLAVSKIMEIADEVSWDFNYAEGVTIKEKWDSFISLVEGIKKSNYYTWIIGSPEAIVSLECTKSFRPIYGTDFLGVYYVGKIKRLKVYKDSLFPSQKILMGDGEIFKSSRGTQISLLNC